ncbi:MAG: ABC transporter permease [Halobacteriaceae archaeon]
MSRRRYVAGRVLWALVATYLVVSVTFGLVVVSPNAGDLQAAYRAAEHGGDPAAARAAYREARGLDRPLLDRYVDHVVHAVFLQWGWSVSRSQYVWPAVVSALAHTAQYAIPGVLLATALGWALGLYTAFHRHDPADRLGTAVAFAGASLPDFWLAVVLVLVFGVWVDGAAPLGVSLAALSLPTYYDAGVPALSVANVRQLLLPTLVVGTTTLATTTRYARAQATEYRDAGFVRGLRASGAGPLTVYWRVLRVALVPLSTVFIAEAVALTVAGAFVVEYVFQIPGIGLLAWSAVRAGDTALVVATTLVPVLAGVLGNLAQDLAYVALDPRVADGDRP